MDLCGVDRKADGIKLTRKFQVLRYGLTVAASYACKPLTMPWTSRKAELVALCTFPAAWHGMEGERCREYDMFLLSIIGSVQATSRAAGMQWNVHVRN